MCNDKKYGNPPCLKEMKSTRLPGFASLAYHEGILWMYESE
jgi:hypothetical protein